MAQDPAQTALIGFGEAAMAFVGSSGASAGCRAFDIKTLEPAARAAKLDDYAAAGVAGCEDTAEAVAGAGLILSLVTADQALAAAESVAAALAAGALFCDMTSIAPQTKRDAAQVIERAGGRYVDVAIMSPVLPGRTGVPLLVCGPHAAAATAALRGFGFSNLRELEGPIGAASAIKMIRSVMVKGIEALSAECFLAAAAAGVSAEVIASLDASWPGADWERKADYNLDRMLVHGLRRAAEMEQAVETLHGLGLSGAMTEATIRWQRTLGSVRAAVPAGLAAKAGLILDSKAQAA